MGRQCLWASAAADAVSLQDGTCITRLAAHHRLPCRPNYQARRFRFPASVDVGLGYSCGNFDPYPRALPTSSTVSVTSAMIWSMAQLARSQQPSDQLPALILQRINPGLYDLFQNGKIRAEAIISLANASCEEMERQIANGENPYKDWIEVAKSYDWKIEMGTGGWQSSSSDVYQAKTKVESDNGKNGHPLDRRYQSRWARARPPSMCRAM